MARGIDMYTKSIDSDKSQLDINSILCSKDIPSYVIEFIIYHEMLHFELKMGHTPEFKRYEEMYPQYDEAEIILSEIGDWLGTYWKDEPLANKDIESNLIEDEIDSNSLWYLYDTQKEFTKSEIRNLQIEENIILPTKDELCELVSDGGLFCRKDKNETPIYYLSNDLNQGYTQFKFQFKHNKNNDSYKLIVKRT